MTAFRGIPREAIAFYERLEIDNSREFWDANKAVYVEFVKQPIEQLMNVFEDEFGGFKLFRPNRDVRFSADKSPYKTHQGAMSEREDGGLHYFHVSADGLFVAGGMYVLASDQLARFRAAVDTDALGSRLQDIVDDLAVDFDIGGRVLATAPRGFARDHPRAALLQHKALTVAKEFGEPAWMHTAKVAQHIRDTWIRFEPLNDWLGAHVGPSTLPANRPGRR